MALRIRQYVAQGLGDSSYAIIDDDRKTAAVIDPQRDIWQYLDDAAADRLTVTHAFDTHVHNDYLSGTYSLAELVGARVVAGAGANFSFDYHAMHDGDRIDLGTSTITAIHTPGHTVDHMAYVLATKDGAVVGIFTGGSLLVGSAGRTDLLGAGEAEPLTRLQRASLLRLASFGDDTTIYPTHGEGSFCAAGETHGERTTTIGRERMNNAALRTALTEDEDTFVRNQLQGLPAFPAYYAHMAPLNRKGVHAIGWRLPELRPVSPAKAFDLQRHGILLVDARNAVDFAKGYPRGATSIQFGDSFAAYVGWVLPFDSELVLVLPQRETAPRAQTQLIRIGFDRCAGYVDGGFDAWRSAGLPVNALEAIDVTEAHDYLENGEVVLLDVRDDSEWERGHVPNAAHIHIGQLPKRLGDVPAQKTILTMCATGMRATMAASIIRRFGMEPKPVIGGFDEWRAQGWPVATGS